MFRALFSQKLFNIYSMSARRHSGSSHASALVACANGSEDIETITIVDTLRRAHIKVTLASVESSQTVTMAHGTVVTADALFSSVRDQTFDAVVVPGGMPGAETIGNNAQFTEFLRAHQSKEKLLAAICAAPAVCFAKNDLISKSKATCYPSDKFKDKVPTYVNERVVEDGNVITSQGPGTAMAFALAIVKKLSGSDKAQEVASGLLHK
jgi:4-methyl-5(b-hydroxyethyl)-thiazole monophosphate biosynthesis